MAQKSFCCSVCGKGGHKASQCPVNNMHIFSSQYTALSNRHCFMCHYRGHIVTDCPANVFLNLGINVGDCYVCGSKSHVKKGCPYKFKFWLKGPWRKEVDEIIKLQGSAVNNCNPYWLEIDDMVQEVKVMPYGSRLCRICGETWHKSNDCRNNKRSHKKEGSGSASLPLPAITWNKSHVFTASLMKALADGAKQICLMRIVVESLNRVRKSRLQARLRDLPTNPLLSTLKRIFKRHWLNAI